MEILRSKQFSISLEEISKYIALDSKNRANNFIFELFDKIENLKKFPYKFRQSYYSNNENNRDMIFKGYTIIYFIDKENNCIILIDIFKYKDK